MLLSDARMRVRGTTQAPHHVSLIRASVAWEGALGQGTRVSTQDIGLEMDASAQATDVAGNIGRFEVRTKHASFGPWAGSFETSAMNSRVRWQLDPALPDGPSFLIVWGREAPPEFTLRIPRSAFATLGIHAADLGLPVGPSSELEATVEGKLRPERTEVKAKVSLWDAQRKTFPGPTDIHIEGAASGPRGRPLDLERTTASVGPFLAGLTGTIIPYETGFRIDAVFKTLPVECAAVAKAEAKQMGPIVRTIQSLGQATGALRVTGTVNASGTVKYDITEPEAASLTWLTKDTCGVSIFGL